MLASLSIEGAESIAVGEIRGLLATRTPGRWPWSRRPEFDEALLAEDVMRVRKLYRNYGYYEATVGYEVDWTRENEVARVRILIEEGPAVHLADWSVELSALPEAEESWRDRLLQDLPLEPGTRFVIDGYRDARATLLARLADNGYPLAELSGGAEVDLPSHSARVHWVIAPGPPVRLGPVRVIGLRRLDERLIREELRLAEGDEFSRRALRDAEERVHRLGVFRSVAVQARPPAATEAARGEAATDRAATDGTPADGAAIDGAAPDGVGSHGAASHPTGSAGLSRVNGATASPADAAPVTWPVEVRLEERPPRSVELGLGFGTEERLRARAGWRHRNLFGGARQLDFDARYSSLLAGASVSFRERRLLRSPYSLMLQTSLERETDDTFDADRARIRTTLGRQLDPHWNARFGHSLEWDRIKDLSPATTEAIEAEEERLLLSTLELGVSRTAVDDRLDPTRGSLFDVDLALSAGPLGSDFDYLRASLETRRFVPVGRAVLAARLRLGVIQPLASTSADEVPLVARWFSGGTQSVRGFDYRHLGPLDAEGEPVGGTSLAEASLELRIPLRGNLGAVLFTDAGQVALDPFTFRPRDVFYSIGAGVRYKTPIGPLRLDVGHVLNPESEIDRFRVHLSVGHAF